MGCFSASNMTSIPNFNTYAPQLIHRLSSTLSDEKKYGYGLSEDISNAMCFHSLIASNINTLFVNHLVPELDTEVNWNEPAFVQHTTFRNPQGYYYYNNVTDVPTLLNITSSPTNTGVKTVLADGEDIQIHNNIVYGFSDALIDPNHSVAENTLIIIARKNSRGVGGNILIDPSVSRIDAILIADGAIINAQNGALKEYTTDADILSKRLIVNGRIYSFNTRG